jgi:hypothetical protein
MTINIYETKHLRLSVPKCKDWNKYVNKNKELTNIVKELSENGYKDVQDYVLSENKDLLPLNRSEGGFCRRISESGSSHPNEISQLRWKSRYQHGNDDWVPCNFIDYINNIQEIKPPYKKKEIKSDPNWKKPLGDYYFRRQNCERVESTFNGDAIELCNGYDNSWCKEVFTDEELKKIGKYIQKYIKDKYNLHLKVETLIGDKLHVRTLYYNV